jgi:hypothetical protein
MSDEIPSESDLKWTRQEFVRDTADVGETNDRKEKDVR